MVPLCCIHVAHEGERGSDPGKLSIPSVLVGPISATSLPVEMVDCDWEGFDGAEDRSVFFSLIIPEGEEVGADFELVLDCKDLVLGLRV